jgi:hypothetical protein
MKCSKMTHHCSTSCLIGPALCEDGASLAGCTLASRLSSPARNLLKHKDPLQLESARWTSHQSKLMEKASSFLIGWTRNRW